MAKQPHESLKSHSVYEALRRRILSMEIAPGATVGKEEIAAEFGVSVAPVMRALQRLASDGLVEVRPQHGSFVTSLTAELVRESMFIRTAIEVEGVRQATMKRDQNLCETLRANIDRQEQALEAGDLLLMETLDEAMHAAILAALGHDRASRILQAARGTVDRMRRMILLQGGAAKSLEEHRLITISICMGDHDLAAAAMRAHLNGVAEIFEDHFG